MFNINTLPGVKLAVRETGIIVNVKAKALEDTTWEGGGAETRGNESCGSQLTSLILKMAWIG